MSTLQEQLLTYSEIVSDAMTRELVAVMTHPTGLSSAGYPYLQRTAWERFRDWVPHLMSDAPKVIEAIDRIQKVLDIEEVSAEERAHFKRATKVITQVVNTAAITAPSDLWLLKHVLATFNDLGLIQRWLDGEVIIPEMLDVMESEVTIDLMFLLSRGLLIKSGDGYRMTAHPKIRALLESVTSIDPRTPVDLAAAWAQAFNGDVLGEETLMSLKALLDSPPSVNVGLPPRWFPGPEEVELGYRIVPLMIGLSMADKLSALLEAGRVDQETLCPHRPPLGVAVCLTLKAAGLIEEDGTLTSVGARVFQRAPGPFGIIEAYRQYMRNLEQILREGANSVWVERSANIVASQVANAHTFRQANDALDALCVDTEFEYTVFIEHAMGRGEAIRQRFERSGGAHLYYVGADLEDAAIDAAEVEQLKGHLPAQMMFIRHADIGRPETLIDSMIKAGLDPESAVMMVGNGLHEARAQTNESMVDIFRAYERAGLVLLFTEASALSVDDLMQTAWNTYHAGFKYVHERSGQGLRPALPTPPSRLGDLLPQSWTECATRAGYVRLDRYCRRSRTIYPYPPANGHNPAISVNHFFMPKRIAERLGIDS